MTSKTGKRRSCKRGKNVIRPPLNSGSHYLRKKSFEPVLSNSNLEAELKRRKERPDARSELERRLEAFRSLLP